MQDRAASGEMTMTIDVAKFLMEWIKHHIIASDRRIANYMTTRDTRADPSHSTMTPHRRRLGS
jgi:hemerythrin